MKILITGMNKNQCTFDFYLKQQLKVVPSHYSLVRALRDMGHEVDQRAVIIGEDLNEYDEVITFIHNPSGFAGFVYNALWAIHKRPNCILAFDDWQTDSIYNGLLQLQDPKKLFRKYVKDTHTFIPDDIEKYEQIFIDTLDHIAQKKNRMLISAFAGGDPTLLIDYNRDLIFTYNPNPYHLNRQTSIKIKQKEKVFNFAGLVQGKTKKWLKNQKVEQTDWPLELYGSRKDGQDRVTEDVMVDIYATQWGILMPGYFHAGSGWWRARPLQVADAGSILIGDPKEMLIYYGDEQLANLTAHEVAQMSDSSLQEIANAQRDALYSLHPLDKEVEKEELSKCLTY